MPGIFIKYRRADSPDATGRIYDRLVAEFGRAVVVNRTDPVSHIVMFDHCWTDKRAGKDR